MKITDRIKFKENGEIGFTSLTQTKSGNFELSVICGQYAFCSPRETLNSPDDYNKLELAIFAPKEWASYAQLKDAGVFDILGTTGEYSDDSDSNVCVFGWVEKDKIIELLDSI